jgi:hypothetical protein
MTYPKPSARIERWQGLIKPPHKINVLKFVLPAGSNFSVSTFADGTADKLAASPPAEALAEAGSSKPDMAGKRKIFKLAGF